MAKPKLTKDKHKQLWRDYNATNEFGRPIYIWRELLRKYGLDSSTSIKWIIRKFGDRTEGERRMADEEETRTCSKGEKVYQVW